jgi:uncharacterized protein (TIGR03435 family)
MLAFDQISIAGVRAVLAATLLAGLAAGQTFDVASVKPNKSGDRPHSSFPLGPGDAYVANGGLFSATNYPLVSYVVFAYKIAGSQEQFLLPQLPDWTKTERFDIQARAEGNPGKDQMRLMMRALLADRFKLAVHTEMRDVPVIAFVLAKTGKLGPQLRPHGGAPCTTVASPAVAQVPLQTVDGGFPAPCNGIFVMPPSVAGRQRFAARNVTMAFIAESLTGAARMGQAMIDQTGLTGTVDFTLEWTPDNASEKAGPSPPGAEVPPDVNALSLQEALRDQLGITLQPEKTSINVIVLDHVERPSAN